MPEQKDDKISGGDDSPEQRIAGDGHGRVTEHTKAGSAEDAARSIEGESKRAGVRRDGDPHKPKR